MKNFKKIALALCMTLACGSAVAGVATANFAQAAAETENVEVVAETAVVAALDQSADNLSVYNSVVALANDKETKYGEESGSLKLTRSKSGEAYITLTAPETTDLTDYDTLVFRVFNSASEAVKVGICWWAEVECAPGVWTEVKIDIDEAWGAVAKDGTSQIDNIMTGADIPRSNITGLALRVLSGMEIGESIYFSAVYATSDTYVLDSFSMIDGGSIRTTAPVGIRFTTEISAEDEAKLPENAQFGTVLYPTVGLTETTIPELYAAGDEGLVDIKKNVWATTGDYASTDTLYRYHGVLIGEDINTGLDKSLWDKQLTAMSYVKYTDEAGVEHIVWADNSQSRSVVYVAAAAEAAGKGEDLFDTIFSTVFADGIAIEQSGVTVNKGETQQYTLNAKDDMGQQMIAVWSSSNENIAKVDENGLVTAVGGGKATITAKIGKLEAETEISVLDQVVIAQNDQNITGVSKFVADGNAWMAYRNDQYKWEGEDGALKYVISKDGYDHYIRYNSPVTTDISGYRYVVFRVYNDSDCKAQISFGYGGYTILAANSWTEVYLDLTKYDGTARTEGLWSTDTSLAWNWSAFSANSWSGNSNATLSDITGCFIRIRKHESVANDADGEIRLFFSKIIATNVAPTAAN